MSFTEFCKATRRAPSEGAEALYNEARESVAAELAACFGLSIGKNEARRFLTALECGAAVINVAAEQEAPCIK